MFVHFTLFIIVLLPIFINRYWKYFQFKIFHGYQIFRTSRLLLTKNDIINFNECFNY